VRVKFSRIPTSSEVGSWRCNLQRSNPQGLSFLARALASCIPTSSETVKTPRMPRACPVEIHACCYTRPGGGSKGVIAGSKDATGLCSSDRESPRGKPVASLGQQLGLCSGDREPPTGQARGIPSEFSQSLTKWVCAENLTRTPNCHRPLLFR